MWQGVGPAPEMREMNTNQTLPNTDLDIHKKIKPKVKHSSLVPTEGFDSRT